MAKWLNNSNEYGGTTRTCSCCHMTQTVNVYDNKVMFKYCPCCGARMEDVDTSGPMTADEFLIKRVVPTRMEVQILEKELNRRRRVEKAAKAGVDKCTCDNCAYSCVLMISDHNECLGGGCTCCNDYCYKWMPETPISAWLRQNAKYNEYLVHRLEDVFGDDFLECGDVELIKQGLEWMKTVEDKVRVEKEKK